MEAKRVDQEAKVEGYRLKKQQEMDEYNATREQRRLELESEVKLRMEKKEEWNVTCRSISISFIAAYQNWST